MKKATIIHHQGFGDLMTSNPLCNYYSEIFDELVIFVLDETRKKVVSEMYKHKNNIRCVIPNLIGENLHNSSCIICMAVGTPCRPESKYDGHKYIDYSEWTDYEHIKIGCFKEDYKKWESYLYKNIEKNISFSHSFYLYENLPLEVRKNYFSLYRNYETEMIRMKEIPTEDYIVLHDDFQRGLIIDQTRINNTFHIHQLNGCSNTMVDQISILENAKELHFIDSSYSVMIYFLSLTNEKIKQIPKYFHYYARKNGMIYENPTPENWYILN